MKFKLPKLQEFTMSVHLTHWYVKPEYSKQGPRGRTYKILFMTFNILKKKELRK